MTEVENEYGTIYIDGSELSPVKHLVAVPKDGYDFFAWTGDT